MKEHLKKRLAAKKEFTPKKGFNLVGVDDFEEPGDELYLISHHATRGEAEQAKKNRKTANPDETLHIYGSEAAQKSEEPVKLAYVAPADRTVDLEFKKGRR